LLTITESFSSSLEKNDPTQFQLSVTEVLYEMELNDGDTHPWQEAISVLRRGMDRPPTELETTLYPTPRR